MTRFVFTVSLGAVLLFLVQPMAARALLPWFGGSAAVWTTCQLFFQVLLLGGYAWTHGLVARLSPRRQIIAQLSLVAVAGLSLLLTAAWWGGPVIPGVGAAPARQHPSRSAAAAHAAALGGPALLRAGHHRTAAAGVGARARG